MVFGTSFSGDHIGKLLHEVLIEHGGKTDGLGEHGGHTGTRDAMQGFIPPVVGGDAEARDRLGAVCHLGKLFFQCHLRDQISGTFFVLGIVGFIDHRTVLLR